MIERKSTSAAIPTTALAFVSLFAVGAALAAASGSNSLEQVRAANDFYELHVWAWQASPRGAFADMNPDVSCDYAPAADQ